MQLQILERDFQSDYLLCTCSVVTNLVTSLEFITIGCATMLCHFGQIRNGSATTHFIQLSSTVVSSATGQYKAVLKRVGGNEDPASRNEERTRNKPSSAPEM